MVVLIVKQLINVKDSVINMRLGIDNLSVVLRTASEGKLTDDQFKTNFGGEIGGYINYRFKAFDKLPLLQKYTSN